MLTVKLDMEMPETCSGCRFVDENYNCILTQKELGFYYFSWRMDWCPLKKDEVAKVVKRVEEEEWSCCENCGRHVLHIWKYCGYCGRELNWDEA